MHYRIAICDDDPQLLNQLAAIVEEYASARGLPLEYRLFGDAEELLRSAGERPFTRLL